MNPEIPRCHECAGEGETHNLHDEDGFPADLKPCGFCDGTGNDLAWMLALWKQRCPNAGSWCACLGDCHKFLLGDELRVPCPHALNVSSWTCWPCTSNCEHCHGYGFVPSENMAVWMRVLAERGVGLVVATHVASIGGKHDTYFPAFITVSSEATSDENIYMVADGISLSSLRLATVRALKGAE